MAVGRDYLQEVQKFTSSQFAPAEKAEYEKGKKVKVVHEGTEMKGKVVSEPILIDRKREDGRITLSLIVEKE